MNYSNEIIIKPKTKVDDFFKVYIPKVVREKINLEQGEQLALSINIENQSIMIEKINRKEDSDYKKNKNQ